MKTNLTAIALALSISGAAAAATPAAAPPKADPKMAQAAEKATDSAAAEIAQVRADIQKDRNAIVGAAMELTDAQAPVFWDLYGQYRTARKPAADRIVALLTDYARTAATMTDEQAGKLVDEMASIQKQDAATKAEWVAKFKAKLPGKVVARFFQVDNKLDVIINFQLASEIPLVR